MNITTNSSTYSIEKSLEYAYLADAVYGLDTDPYSTIADYTQWETCVDPDSGFKAALYQSDKTGQWVISIAGTDGFFDLDMVANVNIFQQKIVIEQYASMVQFIETIFQHHGMISFDIAGHSLGGFLAQAAAATFIDYANQTYTYAAPGIKDIAPFAFDRSTPTGHIFGDYIYLPAFAEVLKGEWPEEVWNKYEDMMNNKNLEFDSVFNVNGSEPRLITDWGTDIGSHVFIDCDSHSISSMIDVLGILGTAYLINGHCALKRLRA